MINSLQGQCALRYREQKSTFSSLKMILIMYSYYFLSATLAALLFCTAVSAEVQISSREWHRKAKEVYNVNPSGSDRSDVLVADGSPEGFGKTFIWDRQDEKITLVLLINAADDLGVGVVGLKSGDVIEVSSATGRASFDDGNGSGYSSVIGLAAKAGTAIQPEYAPLIAAAEAFAKGAFGKSNRNKDRDPYGLGTDGKFKRCEGGILICLPKAAGVYYSNRGCIKKKYKPNPYYRIGAKFGTMAYYKEIQDKERPRYEDAIPAHVEYGYFLVRNEPNRFPIEADGELYVLPWDRKHSDNQGYYRVILHITRADAVP